MIDCDKPFQAFLILLFLLGQKDSLQGIRSTAHVVHLITLVSNIH